MEFRRFTRAALEQPLEFAQKNVEGRSKGLAKDISVGGMFVQTEVSVPFNSDVVIYVTLPGANANKEMRLPGVVRWKRPDGMGVQFGLLGARETHAITEIVKKAEPS